MRAVAKRVSEARIGQLARVVAALTTEDEPAATAHGSLHDYDRQVPLIVLPPGRAKHAPVDHPVNMVDMRSVAPLLASWLGVKL